MQVKIISPRLIGFSLLSALPSSIGLASTSISQSKSIRTSSDTTRPSGYGLDLFLGADGALVSTTPSSDDESPKTGSLYGGKGALTLTNRDLEIETAGGYYKTQLQGDADIVDGPTPETKVRLENVRIYTDTALLEISARLRLNDPSSEGAVWSAGPVAKAFLGTNASFGPDSMKNTRSAIFLGGQVALTFGSTWKPRIVLEYNTDINLFERQVHIALLSLQFGGSLFTPKTIVKDVRTQTTDETVKKITVEKPVEKQIIRENVRFLLDSETVNFETDKAVLLRRSETFLRELGRMLAQYPDRWNQLTVEGHTDIRGSADHNNRLSLARASAVRDALVKAGVGQNRIKAVGFGFNRPLDPNNNEVAWARNRRVELSFEGVRDARWLREVLQKLKAAVSSLPR